MYQHFKAIGQLVMEIFNLKDLGDTDSVINNTVWILI